MNEYWKLFLILNFSLAMGGLTLWGVKKWLGRVNHFASLGMLMIALTAPLIGQYSPINKIQQFKFSAQEFLDLTLNPPVLPGEDFIKSPPAITVNKKIEKMSTPVEWEHYIYGAYIIGVCIFLVIFFSKFLFLQWSLLREKKIKKFGKTKLITSKLFHSPFSTVLGLSPVVVIPSSLVNQKELKWILRHEFQHIKQGDIYLNIILALLNSIFFFNPLIWWWSKDLKESMEFACDEKIGQLYPKQKKEYVNALLNIAERSLNLKIIGNLCAGMTSLGREEQQALTRRIMMIAKKRKLKSWHVVLSGWFLVTATTIAFSAGVPELKILHNQLSSEISKQVKKELLAGLKKSQAKRGYIVITEPQSGKVIYAKGFDQKGKDLDSDFLSMPYAPFSLLKPVLTSMAIDQGKTHPQSIHNCENGKMRIGAKEYTDYKPFKALTTEDAIVLSSNICNIKVTQKLSTPTLIKGLKEFGFGNGSFSSSYPTGGRGLIREYQGAQKVYQAPNFVFGYHAIYTTPLELTQAYGAILNGGILYSPHGTGGDIESRRVISEETSRHMRSILKKVVENGTGRLAKDTTLMIGGKTASSPGAPFDANARVSFIGAAPIDAPKFLVYVFVDEAKKPGRTGGRVAAPITKNILKVLIKNL